MRLARLKEIPFFLFELKFSAIKAPAVPLRNSLYLLLPDDLPIYPALSNLTSLPSVGGDPKLYKRKSDDSSLGGLSARKSDFSSLGGLGFAAKVILICNKNIIT